MAKITVITGGIGSGKSVVSKILSALGYYVYDCDFHARKLMDNSDEIKEQLVQAFGDKVLDNNNINRGKLAEIVFKDSTKLNQLNKIVHSSVIKDINEKQKRLPANDIMFVETAIAHTSGIDKMSDRIWHVTAPESVRIERVVSRDNLSVEHIKRRIEAQKEDEQHRDDRYETIVNDGVTALLPQILRRLNE